MSPDQNISNFIPLIFVVYALEVILSLTSVCFLVKHLYSKYKIGFVSTFMLALCVILFSYGIQIISFLLWQIINHTDIHENFSPFIWATWLLSHLGIMVSLGFLSFFIVSKRFDIYITKIRNQEVLKEGRRHG
jgi:hypothetical protein